MQELILLQGLPASGKTSWAKAFMKDNNDYIRVNKDDIREYFRLNKYSKESDIVVIETERVLAVNALSLGKSVIVDDTNFNQKYCQYWKDLASTASIQYTEKVFDTPVEECIKRDSEREKSIGKDVILNMNEIRLKMKKSESQIPKV